jgi:hypothetical protein
MGRFPLKRIIINFICMIVICIGMFFWITAAKAYVEGQGDKSAIKTPCTVISTREDVAMNLNMHLTELSKPDFLKNLVAQHKKPMAKLEFPVFSRPVGLPFGRDPVELAKGFIDASWAKWTFPFTYQVDGKEYQGTQVVYPVPLWLDPMPDFSKMSTWAEYDPAHPDKAACPSLTGWQVNKLALAGLIFIAIPGLIVWLANLQLPTADDDAVDKMYNERFGSNKRR